MCIKNSKGVHEHASLTKTQLEIVERHFAFDLLVATEI